ncbi:MAG TPA: DUF4126 domain-containing protein [Candidatus Tumulicola sp.]|nr:DUF4126 domain-containing protein [Candidatus Tumulicola sp.]
MDAASQYALAYALTTSAGVRALLSLAAVAVATHFHLLHPPAGFAWLGSTAAMWSLGALAVLEILADKVPLLDHVLHVAQIALKPAAAAIVVGGSVHAQSHEALVTLMVLGALNALGVHAAVASVRGASTIATGGIANPVVSSAEDAGSIGALVVAFAAPFVAAAMALVFSVALAVFVRSAYRRVRAVAD